MNATASLSPTLKHLQEVVLDSGLRLPLHAQLRNSLERIIQDHFEDLDRFYSESQLISVLGISQGTIRRALADLVHQGLLEKRAAKGSIVRKSVLAGGFHNLAVFLPDYSSPNVSRFLSLLNAECMHHNIQLQPIYTHRGERLLKAYTSLKFSYREGAVVLLENSPRATVELSAALQDKGFKYVVVETLIRNSAFKFVGSCNPSIMKEGLSYLTELGHRRITLLVNEPEEKENVRERVESFESFAAQRPVPLETHIVRCGIQLWENSYDCVAAHMPEVMAHRPSALMTVSDFGALAALKWLLQHDCRVPEDISVLGTDGIEAGAMFHPALSTIAHSIEEMTSAVFELLTDLDPNPKKIFVKPKLIVRETTAPPGKQAS